MKKCKLVFGCLVLSLVLVSGCANSISYHHSERNSIALEAKTTDPVLPVQGTIGVRTRTIVVSPGKKITASYLNGAPSDSEKPKTDVMVLDAKKPGAGGIQPESEKLKTSEIPPGSGEVNIKKKKTEERGESASLISDFYFKRTPVEGWSFGTTTIESAFITGQAAVVAPPRTMTAISGVGAGKVDKMSQQMSQTLMQIYELLNIKAEKEDEQAKTLLARLDQLGKLLPEDISKNQYYEVDDSGQELKEIGPLSISVYNKNFKGVLEYETMLRTQIDTIETVLNNRAITYNKKTIDADRLKKLKADKQRVEKEREEFFSTIGNSSVIDDAVAYVIKDL